MIEGWPTSGTTTLLLEQLADVPDERRGAHFTCAVAFCATGLDEVVVEGRMDGRIIHETRGSGGFGYDVVFVADEFPERTTAELDPRRQGRDLPPRPGAARDRAPDRRSAAVIEGPTRTG